MHRICIIHLSLLLLSVSHVHSDERKDLPTPSEDVSLGNMSEDLRQKAMAGDAGAQYEIGNIYRWGKGIGQDSTEAIKWYTMAAQQGYTQAQNALGDIYQELKDYPEAVRWLKQAAEQGDGLGQANLANMYMLGLGVEQDGRQALAWFTKAAEQGIPYAYYRLGVMYEKGTEVPQDFTKAHDWYRKAAEQGFADAQNNLGILLRRGLGVDQNLVEALRWLQKAADQGVGSAYANIGNIYAYADGRTVNKDMQKAIENWTSASHLGNAGAQFNLGSVYARGEGVEVDYVKAYMWIYIANENDDQRIWEPASAAKKKLETVLSEEEIAKAKALVATYVAEEQRRANDAKAQDVRNADGGNSATTPLLTFDGMYRTPRINNAFWHYVRFYEDGTVITVNSTGTPADIASWFNKKSITERALAHGKWEIKEGQLVFYSASNERTLKYRGEIQQSRLVLQIYSETDVRQGGGSLDFVPLEKE